NDGGRVTAERHRAGGHLIEHGAKAEQVRTGVEILAARLLRRHVGDGTDGRSRAGEERSVHGGGGTDGGGGREGRIEGALGQSEIENLGLVATGHENVRGFDV